MAKDRNGNVLNVGDNVTIIPGMAIPQTGSESLDKGVISIINGGYIMVSLETIDGYRFEAERYGCELWKGKPCDD